MISLSTTVFNALGTVVFQEEPNSTIVDLRSSIADSIKQIKNMRGNNYDQQ